jgi:LytR cell envelope-related transcriptional attenuator
MPGVNIGTARIVIIVALVVAGVAILWNGFGDAGSGALPDGGGGATTGATGSTGPTGSVSPSDSSSPTPQDTPSPQIEGVTVQVFNGTNETGLAAEVQQSLQNDGYSAPADPGNVPSAPVAQTVVYFRGGADRAQNRSDATYLAETYFPSAKVKVLSEDVADVDPSVNVVVILGVDYLESLQGNA